jgi:glucose repression regulatory protein TUP1
MEHMEMERKIQSQVVEMDQIQQTLKTLEANHRRIRQQYEEDIMRMRRQMESGQPANMKLSSKRHRTPTNAGQEDSLMSVVAAAAASSRAGTQRPNSPGRAPAPGSSSRPLQQLGQPSMGQPQQSQSSQQPQQQSSAPAPPLISIEGGSTTPTGRRTGPIPSLNREQDSTNGKSESRGGASGGQSSSSSPVMKKTKSNGEGIPNGKGSLPPVNASSGSSSGGSLPPVSKARDGSGSGESSPTGRSNQDGPAESSSPTAAGSSSSKQQSSSSNAATSGSSASSGSAPAQKSSKASKLNWNCVYTSKSSVSYQETERPAAEMHQSMDHQSVVCCVRFSSDGTRMASGCHKTAQVFDVKTGDRKFIVSRPGGSGSGGSAGASSEAEDAYVRAVCFSPDCTKLVAGMPQNTIRVWDIATNEEGPALTGHESEIYSLDYVNDLIVSGSGDRKVRLWDARTSQCKKIFGSESGGPSDGVTSVALSPDGRLLAAASLDKVVRIWDTETSQLLDRLEGHSDSVYSIAFSPDGKNVISGSLDRNIMLWDVGAQGRTTTRPRMLFQGHKDFVLSVAYTPDGR